MLTYSEMISLAAQCETQAFRCTSDKAIRRNASLALHWYEAAEREKRYMEIPDYIPDMPIWRQNREVQDAIEAMEIP
jgi:hypothetical protein